MQLVNLKHKMWADGSSLDRSVYLVAFSHSHFSSRSFYFFQFSHIVAKLLSVSCLTVFLFISLLLCLYLLFIHHLFKGKNKTESLSPSGPVVACHLVP